MGNEKYIMKLTEAKLKQMILEAMNPLRTPAAIEQLEQDIRMMEEYAEQFIEINNDVNAMAREQQVASQEMNGELWDKLNKDILRGIEELVDIESKIRPMSIKYNILYAAHPSDMLRIMKRKLSRRKS